MLRQRVLWRGHGVTGAWRVSTRRRWIARGNGPRVSAGAGVPAGGVRRIGVGSVVAGHRRHAVAWVRAHGTVAFK